MYSLATLLGWCFVSLLLGTVVAFATLLFLAGCEDEYSEKDDFPDAEWVKDYEEIKNGR